MLFQWKEKLAASGVVADLVFISLDDKPGLVRNFQSKHPDWPVGDLRIDGPKALEPWLASSALDAGTAIPLHLFVDPSGKLRCARSGAIDPGDYGLVRAMLSGE